MKKVVLMCVMVLSAVSMVAQKAYHIKNFGKTDELQVRGSTCLLQVNGFMWIGTSTGLIGFDGKHSYVYTIPDKEGLGGYYSRISSLAVENGRNDRFWVGTKRGIYSYVLMTQKLEPLVLQGLPKVMSVSAMQFDAEGNLWAILNGQAYMIDVEKRKAARIGDGLMAPSCLTVTRNGVVWMGDNNGILYRYDSPNRRLRSYNVKPEGVEKFNRLVNITEMGDGNLALLTSNDGVCLFSPEKFTTKLLLTHDDEGSPITGHTAITPDGENLWIGSERGIVIYNMKNGQVTGIRESRTEMNSLSGNAVHSLYLDDEKGVWAGTYFGGMNRISLSPQNFSVYKPEGEGFDVNVVREICTDNQGNLWVGAEDGGLYLFDREKEKLQSANISWGGNPPPFNVQALMPVGDELWVSSMMNGIYMIDTRTMQLKKRLTKTNKTSVGMAIGFNSMCEQDSTIFLSSAGNGIYIYNEEDESFNLMSETAGIYTHHLYPDRHGNVWLTTFDKGLWKIQKKQGKWMAEQTPFSYKSTTVVIEDSRGYYWVGTDLHGAMCYNDKTGKTEQLMASERLSHQSVNTIVEDRHHRLWFGTFDGLYSYNLEKKVVNRSGIQNGLPSEYLNYSAGCLDKDGSVYMGTYKGLLHFDPTAFFLSRERLTPYFIALEVNGTPVLPGDSTHLLDETLFLTKELNLKHDQNTFSLTYAVGSYRNGTVVWYRYRLNPDEPWVMTDNAQPIQLTNLSTGKYKITLQASYNPDVWEGSTASIYVTVAPPSWLSPGAILSYVMGIVLTVVFAMSIINQGGKKFTRLREKKRRAMQAS